MTLTLKNGPDAEVTLASYPDANGDSTFGSTPLANGAPVTDAAPLPVKVRGTDGTSLRDLLLSSSGAVVLAVQRLAGSLAVAADAAIAGLFVRQDARVALTEADGQYAVPRMSALGALDVRASQGVTASGSVTAVGVLITMDCQDLQAVSVQVTSAGVGTITYEVSNDNVNWLSVVGLISSSGGATVPAATSTSATLAVFPVASRYFRARVSTYTSGTIAATAFGKALAAAPVFQGVSATLLGTPNTNANLQAGTALVGDVSIYSRVSATGSARGVKVLAAAGTNAQNLWASGCRVAGWCLANTTSAWKYVKLYSTASAPTPGTAPALLIGIPPNGTVDFIALPSTWFGAGVGMTITGGFADADTTAVAAGDVVGTIMLGTA